MGKKKGKSKMAEQQNVLDRQKVLEKEIDLIQDCIKRMAQNSFVVKGWLITLVTVILALLPDKINIDFLCGVIILTTLLFWYLDAFFLRTEKLYRWKYEWIIQNRMEEDKYMYDLSPYNTEMWIPTCKTKGGKTIVSEKKKPWVIRIMLTKTLWPLYGIIILFAVIILLNSYFHFFDLVISSIQSQKDLQFNVLSIIKQ